jgi:hypothetical protein
VKGPFDSQNSEWQYCMKEQFISESIKPLADRFETDGMSVGEPALPRRFVWRGKEIIVDKVLEKWKESSTRYGESEKYVRKHWFKIKTTDGAEMKIYFERQPRSKAQAKSRWWLYSMLS